MKTTTKGFRLPYLLTLPITLVIIALVIYPSVYIFYLSFQSSVAGVKNLVFVGLKNFIQIFPSSVFLISVKNTFIFALGSVGISFVLGLGIAYLLDSIEKGKSFFRIAFILPLAVAPVVAGLTWNMMLNPLYGIINYLLKFAGIEGLQWATHTDTALLTVMLIEVWQWNPFVMLIIYAGFQVLPKEPLEAAMIDGASSWQSFIYVSLPLLKPAIIIAVIFRLTDAFKSFDVIYTITRGGPGYASTTLVIRAYLEAFQFHVLEHAAVFGIVMLIISLIISKQAIKFLPR